MRAQAALEFFLLIALALALAAWLIASAEAQMREHSLVQRAALARAALDTVAGAGDWVLAAGNGSSLLREVFVPGGATCFIWNATARALVCDIEAGPRLAARLGGAASVVNCLRRGWLAARITNVEGAAVINCTLLA